MNAVPKPRTRPLISVLGLVRLGFAFFAASLGALQAQLVAGNFLYADLGATVSITGYTGTAAVVAVPSAINGKPVSAIGAHAFEGHHQLTTLTLPASVTSIGDWAFADCVALTGCSLPAALSDLGTAVFLGCTALQSVDCDSANNLFFSSGGILYNKSQTRLIQYPAGKSGTAYTVPNTVNTVGPWSLARCANLVTLTLPAALTAIGDGACEGCTGLASVNFPAGLTSLGNWAFYGCTGLSEIVLPDRVASVGDWCFYGCGAVTRATLGAGLSSLGRGAFANCAHLAAATFAGNAPSSLGATPFDLPSTNFLITYPAGASGFTTGTWDGYPSQSYAPAPAGDVPLVSPAGLAALAVVLVALGACQLRRWSGLTRRHP